MKRLYEKEVAEELNKTSWAESSVITEEAISGLPYPVRRHFEVCGFLNRPAYRNARLVWRDLKLKRGKDKAWMSLHTLQFNSVPEPTRIVYMGARLFNFIPFEGRDKCQDGHGHMLIRILGLFSVVDDKSRKMDESALVTVLAEIFFIPSYALQPYIRWEAMDNSRAKAILEWKGISVSGIFHFASTGEAIRFETHSRWQSGRDSTTVPWVAYLDDYVGQGGLRFASGVRAQWLENSGIFEYVKGHLAGIEFDVRKP